MSLSSRIGSGNLYRQEKRYGPKFKGTEETVTIVQQKLDEIWSPEQIAKRFHGEGGSCLLRTLSGKLFLTAITDQGKEFSCYSSLEKRAGDPHALCGSVFFLATLK